MAFSATARSLCGPVYRQQLVQSAAPIADMPVRHRRLARQSDIFGKIRLHTKLLRWSVSKPGRGGRLLAEAAHSAVPSAAGLFNPANDKVCCELHTALLLTAQDACAEVSQPGYVCVHTSASQFTCCVKETTLRLGLLTPICFASGCLWGWVCWGAQWGAQQKMRH